jgi:hypothetical protein
VPPRSTTDALLRLRQVEERAAMRALEAARQAVDRATGARNHAVTARAELAERMERLRATAGKTTAGQLVARDTYRGELRELARAGDERVRAAERALGEALRGLSQAQLQVEQALRSRQATQRQRTVEDKALARRRERRDQAATDDRWRPPRR